jgi:hypothetical protein
MPNEHKIVRASAISRGDDGFQSVDRLAQVKLEIAELNHRIEDLELIVTDYQIQVSKVLASASWRRTSLIRAVATRGRTAKVKVRSAATRLRIRSHVHRRPQVLTAGPFAPVLPFLPESTSLRRHLGVNALNRPSKPDGSLRRPEGQPMIVIGAEGRSAELCGDTEDHLARSPHACDLLVTVTEGTTEEVLPGIRRSHGADEEERAPR